MGQEEQSAAPGKKKRKAGTSRFCLQLPVSSLSCPMGWVARETAGWSHHSGQLGKGLAAVGPA